MGLHAGDELLILQEYSTGRVCYMIQHEEQKVKYTEG